MDTRDGDRADAPCSPTVGSRPAGASEDVGAAAAPEHRRWWFVVHVLSFGLLALVPLAHAAMITRRRSHLVLCGVAAVAAGASWQLGNLSAAAPVEGVDVAGVVSFALWMLLFLVGLPVLVVVAHQTRDHLVAARHARPQPAVARALEARRRREESRRLLVSDPLLAHELRVGRPDLGHDFDDGGLVDLNGAPAGTIAAVCELGPDQAAAIVLAREEGRFACVEDVFALADLPVEVWERVRDRGLTL